MADSPVVVTIAESDRYISIKVSDHGGGIDPGIEQQIWRYGFTSVADSSATVDSATGLGLELAGAVTTDSFDADPIAGLGFGLPLSQTYAKYFGGKIDVMSMHGLGTDVFLRLHRVGDVAEQVKV